MSRESIDIWFLRFLWENTLVSGVHDDVQDDCDNDNTNLPQCGPPARNMFSHHYCWVYGRVYVFWLPSGGVTRCRKTTVLAGLFASFILAFSEGGYVNMEMGTKNKKCINLMLNYAYEIPYATRIDVVQQCHRSSVYEVRM